MKNAIVPEPEQLFPEFLNETAEMFPMAPELVKGHVERLLVSSHDLLNLAAENRRLGPSDEMAMNLLSSGLEDWHLEQGHFVSDFSEAYRIGMIYGVDIGQKSHTTRKIDTVMRVDDADRFNFALQHIRASYDNLDKDVESWRVEKDRQIKLMGNDLFSVASIVLATSSQELDAVNKSRTSAIWGTDEIMALQIGLIDGTAAVGAYECLKSGEEPQIFDTDQVSAYFPASTKEEVGKSGALFVPTVVSGLDIIGTAAELSACHHRVSGGKYHATTSTAFYQVGANEIVESLRIDLGADPHWTDATFLRHALKHPIAYSLGSGAVIGVVEDIANRSMPEYTIGNMAFFALIGVMGKLVVSDHPRNFLNPDKFMNND